MAPGSGPWSGQWSGPGRRWGRDRNRDALALGTANPAEARLASAPRNALVPEAAVAKPARVARKAGFLAFIFTIHTEKPVAVRVLPGSRVSVADRIEPPGEEAAIAKLRDALAPDGVRSIVQLAPGQHRRQRHGAARAVVASLSNRAAGTRRRRLVGSVRSGRAFPRTCGAPARPRCSLSAKGRMPCARGSKGCGCARGTGVGVFRRGLTADVDRCTERCQQRKRTAPLPIAANRHALRGHNGTHVIFRAADGPQDATSLSDK